MIVTSYYLYFLLKEMINLNLGKSKQCASLKVNLLTTKPLFLDLDSTTLAKMEAK